MRMNPALLHADETIVKHGGVAPAIYAALCFPALVAALLMYLGWLILVGLDQMMAPASQLTTAASMPDISWFGGWFLALGWLFAVGRVYAQNYAATYTLTNHRLIVQTGVVTRVTSIADVVRIQDATVSQSVLYRLLGIGSVTVETAGTDGFLLLRDVAAPFEWVESIRRLRQSAVPGPAAFAVNPWLGQDAAAPAPAGAWHPDPYQRHQLRYWDGAAWTAHVQDSGQPALDPVT